TMFAHKTRHRSPDILIEIVKWMVTQKLNDIRFITPNSFGYMSSRAREINKEAILYLLKSLKSIKGVRDIYYGTFPGEVRPETVTEDLMLDIKPFITNRRISIGLQSGSDDVLKKIHRGHTVDESVNAIDVILKSGFIPVVDIIIGLPGATEKNELKTIEIIEKLVEKGCIIRAHVFMPLPGSTLEKVQYKPTYSKIRKVLGRLNSQGKIEGSWSQQEKYASDSWKITQTITSLPAIKR
ncbi:MAG: TIGR04013 family B12-binding domain/radical SAM domain-containing protein, partial [Candidatus Heimdallarchaeota archaeon]|nr:TIGR04013 family B12-binding domain/radical SAM domain-containing protein [Candidatus Heimdallarchaeota archaeon]MCK4955554.1 TIGR04013 family B12-binding domain/radical SAM domain-containing protein [Candidatus Heimdallarchaeota archaeon]